MILTETLAETEAKQMLLTETELPGCLPGCRAGCRAAGLPGCRAAELLVGCKHKRLDAPLNTTSPLETYPLTATRVVFKISSPDVILNNPIAIRLAEKLFLERWKPMKPTFCQGQGVGRGGEPSA